MMRFIRFCRCLCVVFLLASCAAAPEGPDSARLVPGVFSDLSGWYDDHHAQAFPAFRRSCEKLSQYQSDELIGPNGIAGPADRWQKICDQAMQLRDVNDQTARKFFENHFTPWQVVSIQNGSTGLFTGYYEASLQGSTRKYGPYQTPLLRRPDDLVMVDLELFRENLRGQRIAGFVKNGRLQPYADRKQIESGALDGRGLEMVWVDDPIAAFFLHIQGSGRVELENGQVLRVGYDGQNGHPYYAIGRELVSRGEIALEDVSLQSIRAWLQQHPDRAAEIMQTNASYVFFRPLDQDGPLGAEGTVLEPGRSLAVDRTILPFGAPLWLDASPPADGEEKIQRLVIAQDAGGAIKGAVRGDLFWGHGNRAEYLAGKMKSKGRMWILLPKQGGKQRH